MCDFYLTVPNGASTFQLKFICITELDNKQRYAPLHERAYNEHLQLNGAFKKMKSKLKVFATNIKHVKRNDKNKVLICSSASCNKNKSSL